MSSDLSTILAPVRSHTERDPDKLLFAFLDEQGRTAQSFRYGAFLDRTRDVAAHIYHTHPFKPGERVLLVYPPGLDMICAFYACVRLGLIPVPVYPPSSHGFAAARHRMNSIAADCRAAAVLTDRSYYWSMKLHTARTAIASLSFNRDYTSKLEWIVTSDAPPHADRRIPEAHSDVLFLQYTSGSTSEPKGVMVTHRNVLANCEMVVDHCPVTVSWLPQYHDMGLIAFYLFSPIRGGTTYGCSPIDFIRQPLVWLEAMSRNRATASAAPNFAYEYCLRPDKVPEEALEHLDLSSLRLLLSGAEPVKAQVFRDFLGRFERYGLKAASFCTAYGLAEYTLAVSALGRDVQAFDPAGLARDVALPALPKAAADGAKTLVSCGTPLGSTEVRIVDQHETSREVPDGHVGEVWVTGPSKCLGYWGRPELSEQVFEARIAGDGERGWLTTGDLGFIRDGELFICGRVKDLIIVRGANFYPQDIEAIIEEEPAVRRGCVAAFASEEDGAYVVVVAELRNRKLRPDAQRINAIIREKLGIGVDLFVFIPKRTIPKTSSGKISRHRACARWRDRELEVLHQVDIAAQVAAFRLDSAEATSTTDRGGPRPQLEGLFRQHGLSGTEGETLIERGLDSLGMVEFAAGLEEYLEAWGALNLSDGLQIHWLQKIPISELFELVCQVAEAAPHARLRFRQAFTRLRQSSQQVESALMRRDSRLFVDEPAASSSLTDLASEPGGIFLTAGTGFFGPFLLRSLLEQCDEPIYVLVRARDVDHARRRLEEGLASLGTPLRGAALRDWRRRVVPVCGDLSQPHLGMSVADWKLLSKEVHAIYHNGALVNYLLDYSSLRDTNVGSTLEVLRLASTGRAKVLNHISSTFVFGWSTSDTLFESDNNADMELLDFGYSQSKWVSEQIMLRAIERGSPARVFRPALIAPSVRGGGNNYDIAIRMLAFMLDHGVTATAKNQVSFTPADVAANNIVAISNLPDTVGQTFHVTRDDYSSLLDVTHVLGDLTQTKFVAHPVDDFVPIMIERCRKGDLLFPLVNFFVHSVDKITAMQFKRYDSGNYQEARNRSPFGLPDPPLEEVVTGIVRFMVREGIIRDHRADRILEQV